MPSQRGPGEFEGPDAKCGLAVSNPPIFLMDESEGPHLNAQQSALVLFFAPTFAVPPLEFGNLSGNCPMALLFR